MKIEFINYPYAYTDTGERIEIKDISTQPNVGDQLEMVGEKYKVMASSADSDCVSGVCPIK